MPEINSTQKSEIRLHQPIPVGEFLKMDIPSVEFYADGLLQKQGRLMISASTNLGKSIFVQNLAVSLASEELSFLNRFNLRPAKVCYIDFEMGLSPTKERFQSMLKDRTIPENLFVYSTLGFDLLWEENEDDILADDKKNKSALEYWLTEISPDIIILDPIGASWLGNENSKEDVSKVTSFFDRLIEEYGISVILIHHWRKSTKDARSGGQMASGSYKWTAWVDTHVTLEGKINSLTVSCEKSRNCARFEPFRIQLNPETLWFEYQGEYSNQYTEKDLEKVFEVFNRQWVSVPELIKKAEEMKACSANTMRKLISTSEGFFVDKSKKTHYVGRKYEYYNHTIVPKEALELF